VAKSKASGKLSRATIARKVVEGTNQTWLIGFYNRAPIPRVRLKVKGFRCSRLLVRAIRENDGTWVVGLFDIINAARVKIEPCVAGEKGAEMTSRAIPRLPFE